MSPVCGFCMERGKASADTARAAVSVGEGERERAKRLNREGLSTVAALRWRTGS